MAHALAVLFVSLFLDLTFVFATEVAHEELTDREDDNNETIPTDVVESEVARHDQVEWALNVARHLPNESPNATSLSHYN